MCSGLRKLNDRAEYRITQSIDSSEMFAYHDDNGKTSECTHKCVHFALKSKTLVFLFSKTFGSQHQLENTFEVTSNQMVRLFLDLISPCIVTAALFGDLSAVGEND